MSSRPHEHFEALLMKAVDGLLSAEEQRELDAHLAECRECAAELHDFKDIKETTDAMTARILADAEIEPPRERAPARAVIGVSFMLLLAGTLLLGGFAAYTFAVDAAVPVVIKVGAALAAAGALGLLGYVLRVRMRASGSDPYEEIDQ